MTSTTASKLNSFPSYTTGAVTPEESAAAAMSQHATSQHVSTHHGSSRRGSRRGSDKLGASGAPGTATPSGTVLIGSKPTLISVAPMRFLIMDAPRQSNLHLYIRECRRHGVTDVVRVCEPTYLSGELESAGIALHEMAYPDGTSPPREILDMWLALVEERFFSKSGSGGSKSSPGSGGSDGTDASSSANAANTSATSLPTVAVHCVAGLGRAPVLVAIALVEFANMDPVEAVTLIRKHRRGAINEKQLNYLEQYKRSHKRSDAGSCCIIL